MYLVAFSSSFYTAYLLSITVLKSPLSPWFYSFKILFSLVSLSMRSFSSRFSFSRLSHSLSLHSYCDSISSTLYFAISRSRIRSSTNFAWLLNVLQVVCKRSISISWSYHLIFCPFSYSTMLICAANLWWLDDYFCWFGSCPELSLFSGFKAFRGVVTFSLPIFSPIWKQLVADFCGRS